MSNEIVFSAHEASAKILSQREKYKAEQRLKEASERNKAFDEVNNALMRGVELNYHRICINHRLRSDVEEALKSAGYDVEHDNDPDDGSPRSIIIIPETLTDHEDEDNS